MSKRLHLPEQNLELGDYDWLAPSPPMPAHVSAASLPSVNASARNENVSSAGITDLDPTDGPTTRNVRSDEPDRQSNEGEALRLSSEEQRHTVRAANPPKNRTVRHVLERFLE